MGTKNLSGGHLADETGRLDEGHAIPLYDLGGRFGVYEGRYCVLQGELFAVADQDEIQGEAFKFY